MQFTTNQNRRRFLRTVGLAATLPIIGCRQRPDPSATFIAAFNRGLEGAKEVTVHPAKNPKIIVVHFLQTHDSEMINAVFGVNSSEQPIVKECQRDIRIAYSNMVRQVVSPNALYVEGISPSSIDSLITTTTEYKRILSNKRDVESLRREFKDSDISSLTPEKARALTKIRSTIADFDNSFIAFEQEIDRQSVSFATAARLGAYHSSPFRILETPRTLEILRSVFSPTVELEALNRRFNILRREAIEIEGRKATPSADDYTRKLEIARQLQPMIAERERLVKAQINKFEDHKEELTTVRENEYLQNICAQAPNQDGIFVAAVLLGGDHDLRDNVDEYNAKNPDKRCTLVVVTPKSYRAHSHKDLLEVQQLQQAL